MFTLERIEVSKSRFKGLSEAEFFIEVKVAFVHWKVHIYDTSQRTIFKELIGSLCWSVGSFINFLHLSEKEEIKYR